MWWPHCPQIVCGIDEWGRDEGSSLSQRTFKAIKFRHHEGEGVWGGHEADNPVASIDTGIKRPTM
jgi:hypothetical protein